MSRKYIASFICCLFLGCMLLAPFQNCAPDEGGSGAVQYSGLSGHEPYIDYTSGDELVYHPGESVVLNVHRVYGSNLQFSWFFVEKMPGGQMIDRPVPAEYIKMDGVSLRFALSNRHIPQIESLEAEKYIYVALVATNQHGTDRYEFEVLVRPHGGMALQPMYCMSESRRARNRRILREINHSKRRADEVAWKQRRCKNNNDYQNYTSRIELVPGQSLWLQGLSEHSLGGRYSWSKRQSNKDNWIPLNHKEPVYRVFSSLYDWNCRKSPQHQYRLEARREGSNEIDQIVFQIQCPR